MRKVGIGCGQCTHRLANEWGGVGVETVKTVGIVRRDIGVLALIKITTVHLETK